MRARISIEAPANIAFIKYWGTLDARRTIPANPSISMTLSRCLTHTTVERLSASAEDEVWWVAESGALESPGEAFEAGVRRHLDRLRERAGRHERFRVATRNSFPSGAGMASSASGFAALAVAVGRLLELGDTPAELSVLARLSGSGSAARSVLGGYVQWPAMAAGGGSVDEPAVVAGSGSADRPALKAGRGVDRPGSDGGVAVTAGDEGEACFAAALAPAAHWDLRDIVAVVDRRAKAVSSREGHALAPTSPYFEHRLRLLTSRLEAVRSAIATRSFADLAPVVEEEAIDLHLIAMSSRPPIFYWQPATLEVLAAVRNLRRGGTEVCATMDAGANVHLICPAAAEEAVVARLEELAGVREIVRDRVGSGPREVDHHLF